MNLPNLLTLARIALVPAFLSFGYGDGAGPGIAAFLLFAVASATDKLDGYVARRSGAVTRLGQFLDPTADKLLVGAALVVLVATRDFPLWAAIVIGVREAAVQVLRSRIVHRGGSLPASAAGKAKTALQVSMVSWWLLPWGDTNVAHWMLLAAALTATVWSGIEYFKRAERLEEVTR